jgi:hypothetical protein
LARAHSPGGDVFQEPRRVAGAHRGRGGGVVTAAVGQLSGRFFLEPLVG